MANVYALTTDTHDLYISNGQIARHKDSSSVMQTVKTRLLLVYQEWFLNLSSGLPWFTTMLGKNFNIWRIRSLIGKEILATNEVNELTSLDLQYNSTERKVDINFTYTDTYGVTQIGSI